MTYQELLAQIEDIERELGSMGIDASRGRLGQHKRTFLFCYLGSITRCRPLHLDDIMKGRFAVQIEEYIQNIPMQFVYLMAGELTGQEVTKAAIV